MTADNWDRLAMWTALFVYGATWTVIPALALGIDLWYVGAIWASVYVLAHVREIVVRGHCYLSADSTAFPAVLVTAVVMGIALSVSGVASVTANRFAYVQAFIFSFGLGHILSLLYSALVNQLGVLANRVVRRLRGGRGTVIPRHGGMAHLSRREEEVRRKQQ